MINRLITAISATGGEMPLHEELWVYFRDTYINGETAYKNLDTGGFISVPLILIGLFVGFALASFGAVFNKRVHGGFVRKLLCEECLSPDTAKTLPELNCADKLIIRYAVRRSVSLRKVVHCREEEEYAKEAHDKPFRVLPDEHHFYVPEDMKYTAQIKFEKKGSSWVGAVIYLVILLVALVALLVFMPKILGVLDAFIGIFK